MALEVMKRKKFLGLPHRRVAVFRMPRQTAMMRHRHEFCEIVLILSGTGVHVTGGFRREIGSGDVLVINSRRAHGYERTRGLNLVNVLIHNEVLARIERSLRDVPGYRALFNTRAERWKRPHEGDRILLSATERTQAVEWIDRLETETRSDSPENALIAEAYLTLIVGMIARRYRGGADRKKGVADGGIGGVTRWMEQNLDQPMRVAELAGRAGMSERSFYREFRKTLGCSPVEYLLTARLVRAAEMLQESAGQRRVSEIAEACGFADSNYFSTCFRRLKGCSPRAFGLRAGCGDMRAERR
ncbi:MAG: helix-turn-helix domain-containing protein [Rariglobus sp.]